MKSLSTTPGVDLDVYPLCLGGNVFGWTVDDAQSFELLDAYAEVGGNFLDTADEYVTWVPGGTGGESETMIGTWMKERGNRDQIVVATKVGRGPGEKGLAPATIRSGAEASLRRLQTDYIDVYYAHEDDPNTPLQDTLGAFDELVREGKVRHIAASNYGVDRLSEALSVSEREGFSRYIALQPQYNLLDRSGYEGDLLALCEREGIACVPYFSLAMGFLTGKYRPGVDVDSQRSRIARKYLNDRGIALLDVLDEVAAAHGVSVAAVSLAWLAAQPTVLAPVASARTPEQLMDLVAMADLTLSEEELRRLSVTTA